MKRTLGSRSCTFLASWSTVWIWRLVCGELFCFITILLIIINKMTDISERANSVFEWKTCYDDWSRALTTLGLFSTLIVVKGISLENCFYLLFTMSLVFFFFFITVFSNAIESQEMV